MSSTHTITLLKPDGTGSYAAKPASISLNLQTQDIGTMVCTCDGSTDYSTITSAYENGKITYTRNPGASQTLFIGKISKVERWQDAGQGFVRLQCMCPKAALDTAIAGQGSGFLISTETQTLSVSNYGLTKDGIPASDEGMTRYYPDHDSTETPDSTSPWIAVSSSDYAPQALISGSLTAAATTIPTQSTTDQGFPPRGILYTDTAGTNQELIYYDGYAPDAANGDKYTFYNCVRGVLDTTPAARGNGYQLSGRAVKPIKQSEEIIVEGLSGTWKPIHAGLWRINPELGTVEFNGDLTAAPYSYTDFRYSATHFDVDNASAETLEGVADDILQYATANGGMGLTKTTDYTVDWPRIWVLDDIGNTRPMYVRDVLDRLIENYEPYIWSGSGLGYWFNPTSGKFELDTYEQAGSADVDLSSTKHKKALQKFSSTAEYSSVLVPYTPLIASLSLLSADRVWHPAIGDTVGGQTMTGLTYMYSDSAKGAGWQLDTVSTGSNNVWGSLLVDGNKDTGAGVYWANNNPGAAYIFDLWFPDVASYEVGTIVFVADFRNFIPGNTEARIGLVGWDSYTPGTPPTRGTSKVIAMLKVSNGTIAPEVGYNMPLGGDFNWGSGIIL